jgi:hypothetical protein
MIDPVLGALSIDTKRERIGLRVVKPNDLDKSTVTRGPRICGHDSIARLPLCSHTPQSQLDHPWSCPFIICRTQYTYRPPPAGPEAPRTIARRLWCVKPARLSAPRTISGARLTDFDQNPAVPVASYRTPERRDQERVTDETTKLAARILRECEVRRETLSIEHSFDPPPPGRRLPPISVFLRTNRTVLAALAWRGYQGVGRGALLVDATLSDVGAVDLNAELARYCPACDLSGLGISWPTSDVGEMVQQYDPTSELVVVLIQPDDIVGYWLRFVGEPRPPDAAQLLT